MSSYANFYVGSTTVAGALVGLLFVALSLAPEQLSGPSASAERQAIAATAFTALTDALWISLLALMPGNKIPVGCIVLDHQHGHPAWQRGLSELQPLQVARRARQRRPMQG